MPILYTVYEYNRKTDEEVMIGKGLSMAAALAMVERAFPDKPRYLGIERIV